MGRVMKPHQINRRPDDCDDVRVKGVWHAESTFASEWHPLCSESGTHCHLRARQQQPDVPANVKSFLTYFVKYYFGNWLLTIGLYNLLGSHGAKVRTLLIYRVQAMALLFTLGRFVKQHG